LIQHLATNGQSIITRQADRVLCRIIRTTPLKALKVGGGRSAKHNLMSMVSSHTTNVLFSSP
jgi:hypothetical protein